MVHGTSLLKFKALGPVVQNIVSLTSSLKGQIVKCFKTLLPNTSFCTFQQKYWHISDAYIRNFNEMLTNDAISFELPG